MQAVERLREKRLFLFDMDGTLYLGDRLFPFTAPLLDALREQGKKYLFFTNNSSRSGEAYVEKMQRLGVQAERGDFLTSVDATIAYLREHDGQDKLYYVCGTASFQSELRAAGFRLTTDRDAADGL